MFEVFAGMCFYAASLLSKCDDFVVESYDDQLTCEIVANGYRKLPNWIDPACIPSPEAEPMPEGIPVSAEELDNLIAEFPESMKAAGLIK